jgi:hypothetical protein
MGTEAYRLQLLTIAVLLTLFGWIPGIIYAIYRIRLWLHWINGNYQYGWQPHVPPPAG